MVAGVSVDRHPWTPRSHGGRQAAALHRVCHRMLHRLFTRADLASRYDTPEKLREHFDVRRFVAWVRRQPDDYVDWPEAPGRHARRRKR